MSQKQENIERLIPHRNPFIMVDKVLSGESDKYITSFYINTNNVLCKNEYFRETGIIENIAQSYAASRGWEELKNNKNPKIGYIGSVKNLKVYNFPKTNTEINTEITILNKVLHFTSISGKVYQNKKIMAECELVISVQ